MYENLDLQSRYTQGAFFILQRSKKIYICEKTHGASLPMAGVPCTPMFIYGSSVLSRGSEGGARRKCGSRPSIREDRTHLWESRLLSIGTLHSTGAQRERPSWPGLAAAVSLEHHAQGGGSQRLAASAPGRCRASPLPHSRCLPSCPLGSPALPAVQPLPSSSCIPRPRPTASVLLKSQHTGGLWGSGCPPSTPALPQPPRLVGSGQVAAPHSVLCC